MTYITDEAIAQNPNSGYRYFVHLVSDEMERDWHGYLVPSDEKVIDVVVAEPGIDAVVGLLVQQDWLNGYTVCDFWQPEDECPF
jgi:hypothetical protein